MKRNTILLLLLPLLIGCGNNSTSNSSLESDLSLVQSYIQNLEDENNISYTKILKNKKRRKKLYFFKFDVIENTIRVFFKEFDNISC
jgi:hypothetical protein